MKLATILKIIKVNAQIKLKQFFGIKPIIPYKLLIELTTRCNLKCQVCSIWKTPSEDLSTEFLENALERFGKQLYWISLSGGEPTLYPHLDELVRLIQIHCPNLALITFTTNGQQPHKALEFAKKLQLTCPEIFVTVSLDGDEKLHNDLRQDNQAYQRAQECLSLLNLHKIQTFYGVTIQNRNAEYYETLKVLPSKMKAITFSHSNGIYRQTNKLNTPKINNALANILKIYKIEKISEFLEHAHIAGIVYFLKHKQTKHPIPCEVMHSSFHLSYDGHMRYCMYLPPLFHAKELQKDFHFPIEQYLLQKESIKKEKCPGCWLNCYSPHSMMLHPLKTIFMWFKVLNS